MESPFPTEVCLHFNELGKYIVNNGLGREIAREETLEILKKAADAGLVHGISNTEENPETICNCDLEYCTFFKPFHQMGHDRSMDSSNYRAAVSSETCTACSQCIRRCPMDAIQLKFSPKAENKFRKAAQVDTELCIGCGVCAYKCKAKAMTLERTDQTTRPPKTRMDLMARNVEAALASKGNE
jgi:Pyruvate/2-oxoacid:ferredoxin oxidoreductase delta subunit